MSAGATSILTYKPDMCSSLGIYRTNKQVSFDADQGEEQSGDGADQHVVLHQHGSADPLVSTGLLVARVDPEWMVWRIKPRMMKS